MKRCWVARARAAVHPGVVGERRLAERLAQRAGELLAGATSPGVHDRRQRVGLRQRGREALLLVAAAAARDHGEAEVRAVKARRDPDGVAQPQPADDVVGDPRRRGRGQRDRRARPDARRGIRKREVVGAEIMAPLRDAMGLIDHEQADAQLGDCLRERRRAEALGRDVQQTYLATADPSERLRVIGVAALGVDHGDLAGRHALQRRHLILHQRDQRRDDDGQVIAQQRRQLIADRLARARRHHDQRVAVGERSRNRLGLAGPKVIKAEYAAQLCAWIHRGVRPYRRPRLFCCAAAAAGSTREATATCPRARTCRWRGLYHRAGTRR